MKKIKVALVGLGGMGTGHYRAYEGVDEMELVAVCDVRINESELKEKLEGKSLNLYDDLDEMLGKEQPDMVDIVTPSYLHADMVIKCLKKGINVLCEKPMTLTEEEAERILSVAKNAKAKFMVAHVVRFMKPYAYLAEEIRKGEIGKLLRIDFRRISSVPKWSWNDWMRDEERSGGVGMDLSIHDIDFAQSVLGLPEEVSCIYRPLKDNSSYIISALKYKDAVVTCEGAWYNADIPFSAEFYAYFDDGYIYFKDGTLIKNGEKIELQNSVGGEDFGINISGDDAYQSEIRYFIDCILTGKEPERVTPESSAESIKLVRKLLENTIFKI